MIKKLRIKLIAASMASLFLVLFVIGGIVGILNYRKIVEDADRILEILEENAGEFPQKFQGDRKDDRPGMSPEVPYESRNSQTGGYGLGLSIAAATVESHKGKILAETRDEKSLRITVVF